MFACWVTALKIYCQFIIFKKKYISVDNLEHTNKFDISISDAVVTQTIANVRHANVRQAKCISYSFNF